MKCFIKRIIASVAVASCLLSVPTFASYRYSYSQYSSQKQRDYKQYQKEKEASYKSNRNKSYSERRKDYEKVYNRNQVRRTNTYKKYHG